MERDRLLDTMLQDELRKLNKHLPKNRKTLRDLLSEDSPEVTTVGGETVHLRKNEVEAFSASLPDSLLDRVKLPLVLLRRRELGAGAFTLLGDVYEEYALAKLVNGFEGTFADFKESKDALLVFYKPQVSELMRRFHSLITVGFGLSE
jgi:uncharacterized protein